jgi:hypothetical protein
MTDYLLKTKNDTSLESVFPDLHVNTSLVTLESNRGKLKFSVTIVNVMIVVHHVLHVNFRKLVSEGTCSETSRH